MHCRETVHGVLGIFIVKTGTWVFARLDSRRFPSKLGLIYLIRKGMVTPPHWNRALLQLMFHQTGSLKNAWSHWDKDWTTSFPGGAVEVDRWGAAHPRVRSAEGDIDDQWHGWPNIWDGGGYRSNTMTPCKWVGKTFILNGVKWVKLRLEFAEPHFSSR